MFDYTTKMLVDYSPQHETRFHHNNEICESFLHSTDSLGDVLLEKKIVEQRGV